MANKYSLVYRSLLWTSALNHSQFSRAQKVGAHICVLDLEDAVPMTRKDEARRVAVDFLKNRQNYPYGIRINSIRTKEGIKDLDAFIQNNIHLAMIVLPKVETAEEIIIVNQLLQNTNMADTPLCALIESARGIENIYEIAAIGHNLKFLHGGPADLAADLGVGMDWPGIDYTRSLMILAAASSNIYAIDATDFDIYNIEGLNVACKQAKRLGFIGKSAVHPGQIATINRELSPTEKQICEAKSIVASCSDINKSICLIDGKMIGPPFIKAAKNILLQTLEENDA